MTKHEYLLTCYAEECMEVAQRIHKALRFGIDDTYEGMTVRESIDYEFNDLLAVAYMCAAEGLVLASLDREAIAAKQAKVLKWLEYARERGTLT